MLPERWAGRKFHCPACGHAMYVPGDKAAPAEVNTQQELRTVMDRHATTSSQAMVTSVRGWEPDAAKWTTALHLGLLVMAVAVFSVLPALWEWLAIAQLTEGPPVPPWVYVSLVAGVVLFAFGVYVAQLPDWSTLWVTTSALLIFAAIYAALLSTTWLGAHESPLVSLLRFGDKLAGQRALMWCSVMLSLSSFTAYFVGHTAVQWYNAYRVLLRRSAA